MYTLMLDILDLNIQLGKTILVYLVHVHYNYYYLLSVCYLAGEFARILQKKQPELNITDKDVLHVEIAGLIHDLGTYNIIIIIDQSDMHKHN